MTFWLFVILIMKCNENNVFRTFSRQLYKIRFSFGLRNLAMTGNSFIFLLYGVWRLIYGLFVYCNDGYHIKKGFVL